MGAAKNKRVCPRQSYTLCHIREILTATSVNPSVTVPLLYKRDKLLLCQLGNGGIRNSSNRIAKCRLPYGMTGGNNGNILRKIMTLPEGYDILY